MEVDLFYFIVEKTRGEKRRVEKNTMRRNIDSDEESESFEKRDD